MTGNTQQALRALCQLHYAAYVDYVHEGAWKPTRLGRYLCGQVQRFLQEKTGNAYDILVISVPPQHGKSMTVTKTLPSWYACRYPDRHAILMAYNDEYAEEYGRANLRKVQRFGGELFGVQVAKDARRAGSFEIMGHMGGVYSAGVQAGVTGRAADLMLIDDPIKNREEADSETYRRKIWNEWNDTYRTRLAAGAKVIVIQTRWHEDDLAGRLIASESHVRVINLPCEAEANDPMGRPIGAPLCPELGKDAGWLADYKRNVLASEGARTWNALFQGHPSSEAGNLILREWWQYYDVLPKMDFELLSVDAAFKGGEENDFVAIQGWGRCGAGIYLTDYVKARMTFSQTLAAIRAMRARRPGAHLILVEDKANGSAVIDVLGMEIPGVVGIKPEGGKVARVNAVSYAIEAGNVYLPRHSKDSDDLVEECAAFPLGVHDDAVDAMSQALNRLLHVPGDEPEEAVEEENEGTDFYHFGM